jgi:hypothetical protein
VTGFGSGEEFCVARGIRADLRRPHCEHVTKEDVRSFDPARFDNSFSLRAAVSVIGNISSTLCVTYAS